MNELSKYLVEQILLEDDNPIKKIVVVYVGRFQPFHKGHYSTYQHLVKKFGKNNVFIGTSNKVSKPKSPFNFKEKVQIMTSMFGIPKSKIHQVKNPYQPTEILKKFDETTTAFITVVGEKDKSRLGGKYFTPLKGTPTEGYRDRGYVYVSPSQSNPISGTDVRNGLSLGSDEQKQSFFTDRAYPKYNKTIFNLITSKLNEGIFIPKERIEEWLINEASNVVGNMGSDVDDGPNNFFPNFDIFSKINVKRAAKIGYEIVNMISSKELEDYYEHPIYPNGPVKAVTPFPAGVLGAKTATNQIDIYSSDAYSKWFTHVTRQAALVGYSVVSGIESNQTDKETALGSQQGDKESQSEYENSLKEAINLPVEIGDTLLMGKFKNKKVVVKSIGKDEHGMPTINGKKVVTFRYMNENFVVELAGTTIQCEKCNHSWEIESDDNEKYLCHSCGWDSQQQEYDYDAFDSWQEKNGILGESEDLEERGKMRPADKLRRKAAMAGKRAQIARRRARTMKRRKPLSKLKKIAYKMAYRQVYDEFAKELFPDIKKSDLSIKQSQVVHKNVVRKKGRILKRAKFKFLPVLRAKEVEKFSPKNEQITKINEGIENTLSSKYKVDLDIYEYPNHLELRRVVVPQDQRNKGIGSKVMQDLIKYAQQNNKDIFTTPSSDFGGSKSRLVQFYKSFGFKNNKGSNRDFRSKESMVRLSEGKELEKLGITNFKSLFKKMPSELQKRVYNLKNFGQRLDKHPEGNVLKHTITVVNRSLKDDDIDIAIAAMFHDIGKDETAGIHPKKGHITHFGHEKVSASLVKKYKDWIKSVGGNVANVLYVVKNHMRYKQLSDMRPIKQDKLKSFRAYDKLSKFSKHDRGGLGESLSESTDKLKLSIPTDIQKMHTAFKEKYNEGMNDNIDKLLEDLDNHIVEMFYPTTKTSDQLIKENINESNMLMEGGAYGHMNHPFDTEINLTFGQLKDIVNRALEGNLEFTREKTDGQALAVSWVNGRLVAARNKGHLKNSGENALDIKAVADKFAGRGELEKAYNFAMKDLSDSIKSLSSKQREKIFKGGSCFMNLEVIYPTSVNVIPYGQPLLVLHGTMEYDENGVAIGENADAGRILAGMIKQINKDVQNNYTIQGPPVIKLPKSQQLSSKKGKYTSQISKLQKEFGLKDTDGVAEYHQEWWKQWITKNSPTTLDNKTLMGLVKRWAFMDKKFRLDKKNIADEKTLIWAKKIDSQDQKKISKDNLMKFENIFLGVGADVLEFTSSVLTVNPDEAVRSIKKRIDKTIKDVKKSGDPKKIEKLKLELKRLQSIGGPSKIVPNEGIVFQYKGNTFKLTGAFASVNQLLGIFF